MKVIVLVMSLISIPAFSNDAGNSITWMIKSVSSTGKIRDREITGENFELWKGFDCKVNKATQSEDNPDVFIKRLDCTNRGEERVFESTCNAKTKKAVYLKGLGKDLGERKTVFITCK